MEVPKFYDVKMTLEQMNIVRLLLCEHISRQIIDEDISLGNKSLNEVSDLSMLLHNITGTMYEVVNFKEK